MNTDSETRPARTAWQDYVKANLARIRENDPGKGMKVWMEELGRGFRENQRGKKEEEEKAIVLGKKAEKKLGVEIVEVDLLEDDYLSCEEISA